MQLPPDNDAYHSSKLPGNEGFPPAEGLAPHKSAFSIQADNRLFGDSGVKQIPAQSQDVRPRTTSIDIVFIAEMGDHLVQRKTFL